MVGTSLQRLLRLFGSLAILLQASDTQVSDNYIGCFQDRRHEWSFFWWPPGHTTSQTATSCNQICANQRFSYFGMGGSFGTDCHCGNGGYDIYPPSGECTTCDRFGQMFGCGAKSGDDRILGVYKTSTTGTRSLIDDRFIGCWSAGDPKGVLDFSPMTIEENNSGLTLESCLRHCWSRGYIYAGIMFATNCYCGNDLLWEGDNRTPVSTASCDLTCDGDDTHVCGGQAANVISIYRAAPTEPFWGTYVGCFTDLSDDWVFFWWVDQKFSRFHPVSSCHIQCKLQGFLYFGLGGRYGSECYCGNGNYARYGMSVDCKECNLQGETFSCGARYGYYRLLSVYKISDQSPVDQRYVGCWTADNPIYVLGDRPVKAIEDSTGMTVPRCIDECVKLGKVNAGLIGGNQCYCGSALKWVGTNKRPASAASCDARCSGDASYVCGGASSQFISIYRAECPNGTYVAFGRGCTSCSCNQGALCDRRTGACPGECGPGWKRDEQNGTCTKPCPEQKYGVDCQFTCHCYGKNVSCDRVLGKCPGPCATGWTIPLGDLACSKRGTFTPQTQTDEKKKINIMPIAVGAGVGGFFLLLFIIIACCCKKRKDAKKRKRMEEEAAMRKLEEARQNRQQRRRK